MADADQGPTPWRPWHVSLAVFVLSSLAAFYFLTPSQVLLGEPTIAADVGAWALVLGGVQVFLVLLLVALFHRGTGVMYCDRGFPGITTWSAAAVTLVSILFAAFAGFTLGASFVAEAGQGREDFVCMTFWALGGWLAAIVFVPLRRKLSA